MRLFRAILVAFQVSLSPYDIKSALPTPLHESSLYQSMLPLTSFRLHH